MGDHAPDTHESPPIRTEVLLEALRIVPSAVLLTDEDLNVIHANAEAERLLAATREDLIGSELGRWLSDSHAKAVHTDWNRFLSTGTGALIGQGPSDGVGRRKDGSDFEAEFSVTAVMNTDGWSLVLVFEGHISDTTREQILEVARRESRLRSVGEMAAGVAHNLNNHLGGLLGYIQLMRAAMPPGTRQPTYLDDIDKAALDAARIVRRLQEFAVGAPRDAASASADLNETLTSILRLLRPRWLDEARLKDIAYDFSLEFGRVPRVQGHSSVIAEVTQNLVLNALRAMPKGGTITIRTWEPRPRIVAFSIRDSGDGIGKDLLPRLFKPFVKGTNSIGGHGLGLYTCQWLVDNVGGTIRARNAPEGGAEFIGEMRAAVADPAVPAVPVKPSNRQGLRGTSVLAVDDQPEILDILTTVLSQAGARVVPAKNGTEAMEAFAKESFDVVISDMGLPDMSGLKLLGFVRVRDPGAGTVLVTGFRLDEEEISAAPNPPDFALGKPFDLTLLQTRVEEALQMGRRRRTES